MVGACPYPVPQGSQVFLRDTARALHDRGHDVHLVVYGNGSGEDDSGLPLHRCPRLPGDSETKAGPSLIKPILDLILLQTLRRVIRQEKIDLVCAHNYEALLVALLVSTCPVLYFAHNVMGDELPHYFKRKWFPGKVGHLVDCLFPRRAQGIVVPHHRLQSHLLENGCSREQIYVVPPPIDVDQFRRGPVSSEIPSVLYAGNLDAYQNLDLLFDAMKKVRETIPKAELLIATAQQGDFPNAQRIHVPNFEALNPILAQDRVLAIPRVSWSGYPIKLLNAMAAGRPVVACDSAAYPLTHDHDGLVVPDNDVDAFGAAIVKLMKDPEKRAALGEQAHKTIKKNHAPQVVGELLEKVVLQVLQAARR
jgi:glycosyltransferase involved in cell wall biosynthesis